MPQDCTSSFNSVARRLSPGILAIALAACGGGSNPPAINATTDRINGIAVPPKPDDVTNNATLKGIDSNGNGIRDDIDRVVATEFGADTIRFNQGILFARTEQAALLDPSPANVNAHVQSFRCLKDGEQLQALSKTTRAALNTPERRAAYVAAFAGVTVAVGGCS